MRYRLFVLIILIVLVGAWGAGCAGVDTGTIAAGESPVPGTPTAEPQPTMSVPTPSAEPTVGVVPPGAQDVVALAQEDLAQRLTVDQEAIDVISVEAVEWPNTSLGCPEPGKTYGETVNPGFRIILRAAGERYTYHTLRDGMVILCEDGQRAGTPIAPSRAESGLDKMVRLAREELARRLSVAPERIDVLETEPVEWSDASLGCPEPGQMYAQVVTPGFRVVLEARGERYGYHTDREQTVVLCKEEAVMGTPTASSPIEPELDNLIQSAKEDLAQRLSIKPDQIEVIEARLVVWPDASMGCPQPGMRYKQVPYDGALIRLRAEGRVYEYHSGGARGLFLCEQSSGTPKSTPPKLDLPATPPNSEDS